MFPMLECIALTTDHHLSWEKAVPQILKTAVEDCLRLPTLDQVRVGDLEFPLSLLDTNVNIKNFSISQSCQVPDCPDDTNSQLQLKSLQVETNYVGFDATFTTWVNPRIVKLQSLKSNYLCDEMILEFLEVCSGTLHNLDIKLQSPYGTRYNLDMGDFESCPEIPSLDLSSLPHLQHFTIRMDMEYDDNSEYVDIDCVDEFCISYLPSAVEILETASSMQHLTIEICVNDRVSIQLIDFLPLTMLAKSSAFRQIDLYIVDFTHSQIVSELGRYEGLDKLIEEGVLIIHGGEAAP